MTAPAFHLFNSYGPICGTERGVNAGDMEPPEVTCRRCMKCEPPTYARWQFERRDGKIYAMDMNTAVDCPECGGQGSVQNDLGNLVRCPRCHWLGRVMP